jgi:DinB family protein
MNRMELIRWAMQMTDQGTRRIVDDMRESALLQPMPGKGNGGNHAMWIIGHLALIEGEIPKIILGEHNPVEHWRPLFGIGSQPKTEASAYPAFDEVHRTYHDLRAKNLKLLDEIGDSGLDRAPKAVPPGFENEMRTIGQTFLLISLHNMVHYGQVADVRRAAGKQPLI